MIFAVVFAVFISIRYLARPYDKTLSTYTAVTIEEGQDLDDVAAMLEEQEIIGDAGNFALVSKLMRNTDFKPGMYFLSPSMTSVEISRLMTKGLTTSQGFNIPEGYTVEQVATALARDGLVDREKFLRAAASKELREIEFVNGRITGSDQVQGFLFPGSYSIDTNADESMIIITMLDGFGNFFNDDYRARAEELGLSIREVVVIASIIENETSVSREMPEISAVIHNRLNLGIKDDTGILKDAKLTSVPLCSPGPDAIIAALYPDEQEYIYYVHSSRLDGTHLFTDDEEGYDTLVTEYNDALEARKHPYDVNTTEEKGSDTADKSNKQDNESIEE